MIKAWMIGIVVLILAALAGLTLLNTWDTLQQRSRGTERPAQRSWAQPVPTWQGMVAVEPLRRMGGMRPHACPHEDGDPAARLHRHAVPCIWQNPRTQKMYYVSSVEYLD